MATIKINYNDDDIKCNTTIKNVQLKPDYEVARILSEFLREIGYNIEVERKNAVAFVVSDGKGRISDK